MSDSITASELPEDKQIIQIHLENVTLQQLQYCAEKRKLTIEEFILRLITKSISNINLAEQLERDLEEWGKSQLLEISPLDDFSIKVKFGSGLEGIYDLKPSIKQGGVFSALSDNKFFKKVEIGGFGDYITWPGDIEIGMDTIYKTVMENPDRKEQNIK